MPCDGSWPEEQTKLFKQWMGEVFKQMICA
jgi:hypothetical protein